MRSAHKKSRSKMICFFILYSILFFRFLRRFALCQFRTFYINVWDDFIRPLSRQVRYVLIMNGLYRIFCFGIFFSHSQPKKNTDRRQNWRESENRAFFRDARRFSILINKICKTRSLFSGKINCVFPEREVTDDYG